MSSLFCCYIRCHVDHFCTDGQESSSTVRAVPLFLIVISSGVISVVGNFVILLCLLMKR